MSLMVPDVGEVKILELALKEGANDQTLHLFVNNITPAESDVTTTYTEMNTFGYAPISIPKTSWTASTSGGVSDIQSPIKSFTFDNSGTSTVVYGYFITLNDASNTLLWSEKFAVPVTITGSTNTIDITPKIILE